MTDRLDTTEMCSEYPLCGLSQWSCNTLSDLTYEENTTQRRKLALAIRKDMGAAIAQLLSKYEGITYIGSSWLHRWGIWKRVFCPKGIHLLDEVQTASDPDGWNHYLSCDACNLMVEIGRINREYVD